MAKNALHLSPPPPPPVISPPISPTMNPFPFSPVSPRPFSAPFHRVPPYWDPKPPLEEFGLPIDIIRTSPFPNDYYSTEAAFNSLGIRGSRNSPNITDYPVKTCHYFNKGFCKHGSNCRFLHEESFLESYPHMYGPNSYDDSGEEQQLEFEITELLKSRRGNPVSIASLPTMYHEKYGRHIQADGYLTESQRHGKAGYSLTKLLARLKNSVRLIDRPHGQHAVILAEDAPKYMEIRGERNDPGPIVNGSRQIYLTFPAESTFTEEDVSNYFSTFGTVQDVRIPCQQKRMFGFVTFASADTVKLILSKGNPHYVCGARVLVKPYREKSKQVERKYQENFDHPMYYNSHPLEFDSELRARSSRLFRRQLMEEHKQAMELETMRLSQLQLASNPPVNFGYSMDELREGHPNFPTAGRISYILDFLNSGSTSDDNSNYPVNNCGDQESSVQGINLPESPFASAAASGISAVV
ncbi:hypothetical protein ACJIZ3_007008 [Penstemon smallii]|uniref:Zinc finger CCCH domain-containing protein 18-like n=1 Tax=Penstemon smallii TaxID=265156 RepID=A0ABD3S9J9_9LAMI